MERALGYVRISNAVAVTAHPGPLDVVEQQSDLDADGLETIQRAWVVLVGRERETVLLGSLDALTVPSMQVTHQRMDVGDGDRWPVGVLGRGACWLAHLRFLHQTDDCRLRRVEVSR